MATWFVYGPLPYTSPCYDSAHLLRDSFLFQSRFFAKLKTNGVCQTIVSSFPFDALLQLFFVIGANSFPSSFTMSITRWSRPSFHNELKCGKKSIFGRTMHGLPQRLNSTFLEIILSGGSLKETRNEEKQA